MATNLTYATVLSRARGNLNDRSGTFWTDAALLPHAGDATIWAYNELAKYSEVPFQKVTAALTYLAATEDIAALLPADFYEPLALQFRLDTSEEWRDADRRDSLPSRETNPQERVVEWEFRNRSIFVNKGTAGGLLRLTYLGLLSAPAATSDPVLMDNLVSALGFATASIAAMSRGQVKQAQAMMETAMMFMDQITTILVKNLQNVPRRSAAFSSQQALRPISRG